MPISVDRLFGIHAEALTLRARRGEALASNLANVDTHHYKAPHLGFESALKRIQDKQAFSLPITDTGQFVRAIVLGSTPSGMGACYWDGLTRRVRPSQLQHMRFAQRR